MSVTPLSAFNELWDVLEDARTILVLSPDAEGWDTVCSELLSVASIEDLKLLSVTIDEPPDERLDEWRGQFGELPAETGVIAVGEQTRSMAAARPPGPGMTPVTVDTVSDPADLTGLAIAIGAYLDAWSEAEGTPVVCFHTLTSLLFRADEARVFRFIHSTTGRLRDIGAVSHYHLNPDAHDVSTINAFSSVFDAVVEVGDDGQVTIRKRR